MSYTNVRHQQAPPAFAYGYDLLTYRHFAANLVAADLRARFRRSAVGILWAVLQPLCFSLVIAFVWANVFRYDSVWDFAIYVFSGMLIWTYFSETVLVSQDALISAEGYLRQTRIPFLVFQLRTPLTNMVMLLAGCVGLIGLLIALGRVPPISFSLLLLPVYLLTLLMFAVPVAIVMSIMGTHFRDLKYISMIAIQALFFVSPIMLGREVLADPRLTFLEYLNPIVPLIDMFRAVVLEGRLWRTSEVAILWMWIAVFWIVAAIAGMRSGRKLVYAL